MFALTHELPDDLRDEIEAEARAEQEANSCQCDLELTLQELETGKCRCCGKEIL